MTAKAIADIKATSDGIAVCRPSSVRLSTWKAMLDAGVVIAHYSVVRVVNGKQVNVPCDMETFHYATKNTVYTSALGHVYYTMGGV